MADSDEIKVEWICSEGIEPLSQTKNGMLEKPYEFVWPSYVINEGYLVTGFKIKNKVYTEQVLRSKSVLISDAESDDSQSSTPIVRVEIQTRLESDMVKYLDKNGLKHLLGKLPEALFSSVSVSIEKQKWLPASTINGRNFYTQTITVSKLYVEIPTIMIDAQTIPSVAEEQSYAKINYAAADKSKNQITLYAEQKPEETFMIRIIGAR